MDTLNLPSKFRLILFSVYGFSAIAGATLVVAAMGAVEPGPPPAGQYEGNRSIEQNMLNRGHSTLPTSEAAPNRTSAAVQTLKKAKLEEAKRDASTLAALADSLKDDMSKSNENVVPLSTMEKAEEIERLAKKIKKWAKWN